MTGHKVYHQIPVTAQISLTEFPAEIIHPIDWDLDKPAVSLLGASTCL